MTEGVQKVYPEQSLRNHFYAGLALLNVEISESQMDQFFRYKDLVLDWNTRINLTAITDEMEFISKHFIDSLTLIPALSGMGGRLIDIGTGAGFPGIPIKCMRPDMQVTLLDSLDKRVKFLNTVITDLALKDIQACHDRAEDAGLQSQHREKYDVAVARAVAALPVLLEYCLPFVKVGGTFFAMKGISAEEIAQSKKALSILGAEILEVKSFHLPLTDNQRNIIRIKKIRQIPTNYPRKAGTPTKKPL